METMVGYFVKVNVAFIFLFLAYFVLLKNERFFMLNRVFLLTALVLPIILPLLPTFQTGLVSDLQQNVSANNPLNIIYTKMNEPTPFVMGTIRNVDQWAFANYLFKAYMVIAFILLLRFGYRIFKLFSIICKSRISYQQGIIFCEHDKDLPPFSFFRWMVINQSSHDPKGLYEIIVHEKIHIKQLHSLDIILAEWVNIIFWINPITGFLKRYIKLNLEFLADKMAMQSGIDKEHYQFSILQNSLGRRSYPLANLFNSLRIKSRIKMINSKKSPDKNLYKFIFVLPILVTSYFAVNPTHAETLNKRISASVRQSTGFEGYYHFDKDKNLYLQIIMKNNKLVLKQLWDDREIPFEQKSALYFYNVQESFPLTFSKDANGEIISLLAFGRDTWIKVKEYKPVEKKQVVLSAEQMHAFAGRYRIAKDDQEAFLQFTVNGNTLEVKELWSGKLYTIVPESELVFFGRKTYFPVVFSKDKDGNISQALIFNKDVWEKLKN